MSSAMEQREPAAAAGTRVREAAAQAGDYVQAQAARVAEGAQLASRSAMEAAQATGTAVRRWSDEADRVIRQRPLMAVGIAVAAGFVLGKLLLRR
jgi:ElaB/YqjD/DUF883 family membrane-anchored ribosome-binding protein